MIERHSMKNSEDEKPMDEKPMIENSPILVLSKNNENPNITELSNATDQKTTCHRWSAWLV
jgi:hypothetical protein